MCFHRRSDRCPPVEKLPVIRGAIVVRLERNTDGGGGWPAQPTCPRAPCAATGPTTHTGRRANRCDAADTRAAAVTWLAKTAGMDPEQAEPTIADLSRAVGSINAVRVLEVLLAAGWRAPGGGQ